MNLTDEERKVLTEYLGECPNELGYWTDMSGQRHEYESDQRTFDTPADLHAVYSAMVRKGEWDAFCDHTARIHNESYSGGIRGALSDFTAWLFCLNCPEQIPERMKMAVEFMQDHKQ